MHFGCVCACEYTRDNASYFVLYLSGTCVCVCVCVRVCVRVSLHVCLERARKNWSCSKVFHYHTRAKCDMHFAYSCLWYSAHEELWQYT